MNDTLVDTSTPESAARGLSPDELDELDTLLNDLRAHAEEIPQWEFCDGFLTALVCSRRPIGPEEYLPMLLGDGQVLELDADHALPQLPTFATAEQQARFLALFTKRWQAVQAALDLLQEQRTEEHRDHHEAKGRAPSGHPGHPATVARRRRRRRPPPNRRSAMPTTGTMMVPAMAVATT